MYILEIPAMCTCSASVRDMLKNCLLEQLVLELARRGGLKLKFHVALRYRYPLQIMNRTWGSYPQMQKTKEPTLLQKKCRQTTQKMIEEHMAKNSKANNKDFFKYISSWKVARESFTIR